jgi:hypothetical protein
MGRFLILEYNIECMIATYMLYIARLRAANIYPPACPCPEPFPGGCAKPVSFFGK